MTWVDLTLVMQLWCFEAMTINPNRVAQDDKGVGTKVQAELIDDFLLETEMATRVKLSLSSKLPNLNLMQEKAVFHF